MVLVFPAVVVNTGWGTQLNSVGKIQVTEAAGEEDRASKNDADSATLKHQESLCVSQSARLD